MNVDGTTDSNTYEDDIFQVSGVASLPVTDFVPSATAPFLDRGSLLGIEPLDRSGTGRVDPVDLGPLEAP